MRILACPMASLIFLVGCANGPAPEKGDERTEKVLRRESAEWDILFNARAGAQLSALYADDAYTLPPNGAKIYGKPALRKDFETLFETFNARHVTQIDEYVLGGDRAVELAHYTLTLQPRAGGETVVESGRRVICWQRNKMRWEIAWELWNTQGAPEQKNAPANPGAGDDSTRRLDSGLKAGK